MIVDIFFIILLILMIDYDFCFFFRRQFEEKKMLFVKSFRSKALVAIVSLKLSECLEIMYKNLLNLPCKSK